MRLRNTTVTTPLVDAQSLKPGDMGTVTAARDSVNTLSGVEGEVFVRAVRGDGGVIIPRDGIIYHIDEAYLYLYQVSRFAPGHTVTLEQE